MLQMFNLLMKILECMSVLAFSVLVLSAIITIKLIFVGIKLCSVCLFLTQVIISLRSFENHHSLPATIEFHTVFRYSVEFCCLPWA